MAPQRPLHMLADDGGRVHQPCSQGRYYGGFRRGIAQGNGNVPQPTLVAGAAERATLRALLPQLRRPTEQLHELARIERVADREVADLADARELVPRAKQLAIVATEDPVTDQRAERLGNGAAQLDREI